MLQKAKLEYDVEEQKLKRLKLEEKLLLKKLNESE